MIRLCFFDVDGTLSAPYYPVNGQMHPGMSDDGWIHFCAKYGEDAYQWCKPLPKVREYAAKRKQEGAKLYVLTTSQTSFETRAKVKFVSENYPDLCEDIIAVSKDEWKWEVMRALAQQEGADLSEIELVEDTFTTVLKVDQMGMVGTHISTIVEEGK